MCYSKNASILSFTFGVVGSLLCVSLGTITDKIIGFFMLFVSLMQGIEFLLWKHQICDNYNKFISLLGMVLNHLQPIVLGLLVLLVNSKLSQIKQRWIHLFMGFYLIFIIPYSLQFLKDPRLYCTIKKDETAHLLWNWNNMKYHTFVYTVFLITFCALFLLGLPKLQYGIYASLVAVFTYCTSLYFYPQKYTGAIWCYYVVFLPVIYYLLRKSMVF